MRPRQQYTPAGQQWYDEARAGIRSGDVLMYRGHGPISRLIRLATGSPYSHAGIAARWNDRLMVMEAVGKGVVVTPLSANVTGYHGSVELFTAVPEISDEVRERMIRYAQEELGKEYGRWNAIVLGLRLLLKRGIEARDRLRRDRRLFCSHYVAQVYNVGGHDLKRGVSDRFMSPGDIARSPVLRRVAALKGRPLMAGRWPPVTPRV
jgi:hypothetical protein